MLGQGSPETYAIFVVWQSLVDYFKCRILSMNDKDHEDHYYSKTCLKQSLSKSQKIVFQDQLSLNAILSTFIKLPFVIEIFALSIFEWSPKTGFTVYSV